MSSGFILILKVSNYPTKNLLEVKNMKKIWKRLAATTLVCCMMMAMFGCGSNGTSSTGSVTPSAGTQTDGNSSSPRVLKLGCTVSSAEYDKQLTSTVRMIKYYVDEIPKRTNGEIEIAIYLDGQLASGTSDIINATLSGAIDMGNIASGNWNEYTDACIPMGVPFAFANADVVNYVMDSEFGQKINQQIQKDVGVVPLSWIDIGFRHVTNNKREICTPDDVKGLKIRTMSDPLQLLAWSSLGASCSSIAYSETFTALQQGVVDGQENPATNIYSARFYEVQKYMTTTGHTYTGSLQFMSQDTWDSLTEEQQQVFREVAREAELLGRETTAEADEEFISIIEENGVQIHRLTPEETKQFQAAMTETYTEAEKMIGAERWAEFQAIIAEAEAAVGF